MNHYDLYRRQDPANADDKVLHPAVGRAIVFRHHRTKGRGVENRDRPGAEGLLLPLGQQLCEVFMLALLIKHHVEIGEQVAIALHQLPPVKEAGALGLVGGVGLVAALGVGDKGSMAFPPLSKDTIA